MYEVVHTRLLYILLTAAHCGLWSHLPLRMARLSVCTIRMRVSCVQSASAPPRPPSSMQTVAGCVHDLHVPGVCLLQ